MSTIILQRFANREYRLTHQNLFVRSSKGGDKYKEKESEKYAKAVNSIYVLQQELVQEEVALISEGKIERRLFGEVDARTGIRALDIINEFQTKIKPTKKGGWGHLANPTTFTKNARHRLLEAGAIVDKHCRLNAWEITCTLPGGTTAALRTLAENTGWLMNELTQIIRRAKCTYWFYVWEFQRRGALHLHLLIADPQKNLETLAHKLESRWWRTLDYLSEKNQVDLYERRHGGSWRDAPSNWQSHIAPIEKSVAAYFSKYASKNVKPSSSRSYRPSPFSPSRWWGCSTEIKAKIKAYRRKWKLEISPFIAKQIQEYLQGWLHDHGRIKNYSYEFQLGQTANGTELGGGEVWINYYNNESFARMQTWEQIMWDGALAIAHDAGEYTYPQEGWNHLDRACTSPLYAKMEESRKYKESLEITNTLPPHPPLSQPSSIASQLSKSRRTQAQPCLDLRALAIQFLAGGGEGTLPKESDNNLQLTIPGLTTC